MPQTSQTAIRVGATLAAVFLCMGSERGCSLFDVTVDISAPTEGTTLSVGEVTTLSVKLSGERSDEVAAVVYYRVGEDGMRTIESSTAGGSFSIYWTPTMSEVGSAIVVAFANGSSGRILGVSRSIGVAITPGAAASQMPESPTTPSHYAVDLELPDCDATRPDVLIIDEDADWALVNDPRYQTFCVASGDYSGAGRITLASNGTSQRPRVLRWMGPASENPERHPIHLPPAARVYIQALRLEGASHWVIDGIGIREPPAHGVIIRGGAQHNIFNRMLIEHGHETLFAILDGSHDNTLQNSVLREARRLLEKDTNCINLMSSVPNGRIYDTRIVGNEVYDCADGIQLVNDIRSVGTVYPGTLIADNDFYVTPRVYTDCKGNYDRKGDCASTEQGIELKAGSAPGEEPVRILDNRVWGYRRTDVSRGRSGSWGACIATCCDHSTNVLIQRNIAMDCNRGISTAASDHVSVVENIVYDIHEAYGGNTGQALLISGANEEFYRNVVIDAVSLVSAGTQSADVRCNTFIDVGASRPPFDRTAFIADYNAYFNAFPLAFPGTQDISYPSCADAQREAHCFSRKRWTGPEQVCIPHVAETKSSPRTCDPALGTRADMGIDDELY